MIIINNAYKTFSHKGKKVEALKDVSIHVEKGDIYGIIGYSGAGKSTLIRLMNKLETCDKGEVLVNGKNINGLTAPELRKARKKIGMIFQSFNLLNSVNVYENIAAPLKNHTGLSKKEIDEKVRDLLKLVGLQDKINAYPNQLSGGQKQRVAIARAISNEPEILLCDEATSALDPNTTKSILKLIKEIKEKLNITVVIITHQMEVVKAICNKVAIMDKGRIAESGDLVEVFSKPQTAIAREFTSQSIQEEGLEEKIQELKRDLYRFTFVGETADKPIMGILISRFNITINIISGNIENLSGTSFGHLVVDMTGEEGQLEKAKKYVESKGIKLEVIKYVESIVS